MNYKLVEKNLIGVAGDWHGNGDWAERVIKRLADQGVRKIVQVGDFGLWPGMDGMRYLDQVNAHARRYGVKVMALMGNHDWNDEWGRLVDNNPPELSTGGVYVRSHIVLLPRTGHFFLGDESVLRRVAVAGGAVSIDKRQRVMGTSWWAEEELTDREVDAFPERQVDILFTHDCSNRTPFKERIKPDLDSHIHRQRIDRVLAKTAPKLHFHGHMHEWYDWVNQTGPSSYTQTYGLNMDGTSKSTGILDLTDLSFKVVI